MKLEKALAEINSVVKDVLLMKFRELYDWKPTKRVTSKMLPRIIQHVAVAMEAHTEFVINFRPLISGLMNSLSDEHRECPLWDKEKDWCKTFNKKCGKHGDIFKKTDCIDEEKEEPETKEETKEETKSEK